MMRDTFFYQGISLPMKSEEPYPAVGLAHTVWSIASVYIDKSTQKEGEVLPQKPSTNTLFLESLKFSMEVYMHG